MNSDRTFECFDHYSTVPTARHSPSFPPYLPSARPQVNGTLRVADVVDNPSSTSTSIIFRMEKGGQLQVLKHGLLILATGTTFEFVNTHSTNPTPLLKNFGRMELDPLLLSRTLQPVTTGKESVSSTSIDTEYHEGISIIIVPYAVFLIGSELLSIYSRLREYTNTVLTYINTVPCILMVCPV